MPWWKNGTPTYTISLFQVTNMTGIVVPETLTRQHRRDVPVCIAVLTHRGLFAQKYFCNSEKSDNDPNSYYSQNCPRQRLTCLVPKSEWQYTRIRNATKLRSIRYSKRLLKLTPTASSQTSKIAKELERQKVLVELSCPSKEATQSYNRSTIFDPKFGVRQHTSKQICFDTKYQVEPWFGKNIDQRLSKRWVVAWRSSFFCASPCRRRRVIQT